MNRSSIFLLLTLVITLTLFAIIGFRPGWVFAKPNQTSAALTPVETNLKTTDASSDNKGYSPNSPTPTAKELLKKNWNLDGFPIKPEDLEPFFETSQPESILLLTPEGQKRIYPTQRESGSLQSNQTLFITSAQLREQIAAERKDPAYGSSYGTGRFSETSSNPKAQRTNDHRQRKTKLPENDFEILSFSPGRTDRGTPLIPILNDWLSSLQGPDYSMEDYDRNNRSLMLEHLSKVFSLGHGGEIVLKVSGEGKIMSEEGPDLFVFHTAFRLGQTDFYWNKFGRIGFSDQPDPGSFRWLDCDPSAGKLKGCVGLIPTTEGGDSFRLDEIGLESARYIRIKDLGNNQNIKNKFNFPTEGVSIDALRLDHAYQLD